jgi:glycosyltransferase involved in cell wall biosynthesis
VVFYDALLADADMPRLFAAATHYWSMSHGEGWDQPMIEAAATGLRLIAPRHSGYTAYLDDTIARLLPARLVPADFGRGWESFRDAEWWEPDEKAAADAVREAIDRGPAGPTARSRIVSAFTWDQAARRLLEILAELHAARGLAF